MQHKQPSSIEIHLVVSFFFYLKRKTFFFGFEFLTNRVEIVPDSCQRNSYLTKIFREVQLTCRVEINEAIETSLLHQGKYTKERI